MTQGQGPSLTVYYDGDCPICSVEIGHYRSCRGSEAVAFVNVADPLTMDLGAGLTREVALARFHIRTPLGELVSGAAGFAALWLTLPGWRWLGRLASRPVVLQRLETAYCLFLPIRARLSHVARRLAQS